MRQQLWACLHKLDDEEDDDRIIELFDTLPDQAMFELTLAELEAPVCAQCSRGVAQCKTTCSVHCSDVVNSYGHVVGIQPVYN